MKKETLKRAAALSMASMMVLSMAACGGQETEEASGENSSANVPAINDITLGEDYQDVKADIKILTNRTDIVDKVYKGYAEQFMELYPNITVEYEGTTDYEESLQLRLSTGDWGDICYIPSSVDKSELSTYFTPMGDFDTLDGIYNYCQEKTSDGVVYGIANGGTASGVAYNKRIWEEAGITELPKTPDEFIDDLKQIQDKTDAIPLYTNFAAGWTMGAWNDYTGIAATGDPDFKNNKLLHTKDPFSKKDDMTGPYAVFYTLYEAVNQKLVEEDPASSDWESSKGKINSGEIATMVLGSWCVEQFKGAGDQGDDIGYMPFPISVDGKQYVSTGGNYSYGINCQASEDNQIAAMLYVKWLLEESPIFSDEGSIPALKSGEMPDCLDGLEGAELLSDNPAQDGEEGLYDDMCNESELLTGDYAVSEVLEAALYDSDTLDNMMKTWNEKWTSAQENLGVEVTE